MQKIAVVSDIHGNIPALEKVAADIESRQVDWVFNLGDHLSGPLWPKETLQYLIRQDWIHILGNHDRHLITQDASQLGPSDRYVVDRVCDSDLNWLRTLSGCLLIQNQFLLFHGSPAHDTVYLLETIEHGRARLATPAEIVQRLEGTISPVLLCGHSHIQRVIETPDGVLIVNPGSVGLPAYEEEAPEYHVMESGSHHARYAVLENVEGNWRTEMIALAYDYQYAAHQARKNERMDWELGLRTGFMSRAEN